jgi:putative two-component system response regulator
MSDGRTAQILLVGAAPSRRPEIHAHLTQHGYEVLTATSADEALHLVARWKVACVLADAELEDGHRSAPLARILRCEPAMAVVLLAAQPRLAAAVASLRRGAMDYLAADERPEEVVSAVGRAIERRVALARELVLAQSLREEVGLLSAELRRERERGDHVALAAMESLVCVVETKDLWLAGHSVRVAQMAASLAAELGRTDAEIEQVRLAGRLHDIGMVGVDDSILSKEGPLTPDEFDRVRAHVTLGSQILAPLPGLGPVASFVRHHHERWDGQGYPDRLVGEAAPWGSRLLGAAEIYDALTTARPYREPMPPDLAVQHMKSLIGAAIGDVEWRALAAVVGRREALVFVVDPWAQSTVGAMASTLHL